MILSIPNSLHFMVMQKYPLRFLFALTVKLINSLGELNCELKLKCECIKISSKVKAKGTSLGSEDALELLRQPEHEFQP